VTTKGPVAPSVVAWRRSVFIVFGLSGFGVASWLSRVPSARDGLHASTLQMGVLALGISIGSVGGFIVAGRIGSRFSPKRVIGSSLFVAAVGLILAGLGASLLSDYPLTMAGLILLGLGNGTCNVTMNVEGAAIERTLARPVMPWFHAVFSIGAAVGASLGALAATLKVSPSVHLLVAGVIVIGLSTVAVRQLSVSPPQAVPHPAGASLAARRLGAWLEPRTLLIGVVVLGMSFANGAANDWVALAMVDGHGVGDGAAALTVDAFTVAVVVARLFGVPILARFGRVRTVQASAVVAIVGLLLFILGPSAPLAIVGVALWGLGIALAFPIGMSAAGDDPRGASARIAIVAAIGYAGSLVGPPLIGFVAEQVGILHALLLVLALVVAAGIVAPVLRPRRRV
jgi:MFS family permease